MAPHVRWDHVLKASSQGDSGEIRRGVLEGGLSAGVELVELDNGRLTVSVLPTRGMGVWQARLGEIHIGWNSPVEHPVHPAYVNLQSRNGLGWLDGFNELLCRCGLAFNGPPGKDEGNPSPIENDLTLHGKVANLPAHTVQLGFDAEQGALTLQGCVDEATLFGPRLRLTSTVTTQLQSQRFTIHDVVTNLGASPTEVQLLYHTNVGSPFLDAGARFVCPAQVVVPRDSRAAEGIDTWETYLGPTPGYAEQAYFFELQGDEQGHTVTLLRNAVGDLGFCLRYNLNDLPRFTQWKCTQPEAAGYVTGLEPGINYPNFKAFERQKGRIPLLEPGASISVTLHIDILDSARQVAEVEHEIAQLQRQSVRVEPLPTTPYC